MLCKPWCGCSASMLQVSTSRNAAMKYLMEAQPVSRFARRGNAGPSTRHGFTVFNTWRKQQRPGTAQEGKRSTESKKATTNPKFRQPQK